MDARAKQECSSNQHYSVVQNGKGEMGKMGKVLQPASSHEARAVSEPPKKPDSQALRAEQLRLLGSQAPLP